MRVIAGSARGRRLSSPTGRDVRPTSDRVREALFNALGALDVIDGATVLDAFAGTGALGIEALSRGAAHVTFVESDRRAVTTVRENLAACGFDERCEVRNEPLERFLAAAGRSETHFDLAMCDPPYAFDGWDDLLDALPAEVVVCESDRAIDPPPGWDVLRSRRYGSTFVVIARRTANLSEQV